MHYYFRLSAALILVCILSLLSLFSYAQNNHFCRDLTILVHESPSGIPLSGAQVTIERNDSITLKKVTNENGVLVICDCTDSNFLLAGFKYQIHVLYEQDEETDEFFYSKFGMPTRMIREIKFYSNAVPQEFSTVMFPAFTPLLDSTERAYNIKIPKIDLDIILTDQETGEPKVGENGYIIKDQTDTLAIITDQNGRITLTNNSHPGFIVYGARYEIIFPQINKLHTGAHDFFHTEDIFVNTRIIRDLKVMHVHRESRFPQLIFSPTSYVLDSSAMTNADFILDLLAGHPNLTLNIIGYFDDEQGESLALKRATAVYYCLVEKGIDQNRLTIEAQKRPIPAETQDEFCVDRLSNEYYTDVIIKITSFDFVSVEE
ncbi:MAG: OmpA family protein [Crocinitomicaceae bacterium]|nr:OmpA family protein [Crocinitomicaceae bacterium]MBK8926840.1 OmpA family protein [Crocinitomicaceae bacterium]